ncbi:hypothetical protein FOZ61_008472 [Perkinsus olseni]|uniref:39S ribosomal protein L54, mitochondrial n=1 Tax=Perkinsus olseni TaxID=32597 RepID=A0A7J6L4Q7_PEROL|nr:hypothetical protein FOL46_000227 [Perkinsus olseni]KAF4654116.1 hypothetical protein FOZ61_008472 [Perkinsus olseni]
MSLLRRFCRPLTQAMVRGPKKKKGGGSAASAQEAAPVDPAENQYFNIYTARSEDEKILADEHYPKWLWGLEQPAPGYGELSLMFVHGVNIENATMYHYHRFLRKHRVLVIKHNNIRLKKKFKKSSDWRVMTP